MTEDQKRILKNASLEQKILLQKMMMEKGPKEMQNHTKIIISVVFAVVSTTALNTIMDAGFFMTALAFSILAFVAWSVLSREKSGPPRSRSRSGSESGFSFDFGGGDGGGDGGGGGSD